MSGSNYPIDHDPDTLCNRGSDPLTPASADRGVIVCSERASGPCKLGVDVDSVILDNVTSGSCIEMGDSYPICIGLDGNSKNHNDRTSGSVFDIQISHSVSDKIHTTVRTSSSYTNKDALVDPLKVVIDNADVLPDSYDNGNLI